MDRARAGGYVCNNYVQEQLNKKKRMVHLARIRKIKSRKPGSSQTLDNNAPVVIAALMQDPRKVGVKKSTAFVNERENKLLLKRISNILTAPPKITDADYQRLRSLAPQPGGGKKAEYEHALLMKRNREFFKQLKKAHAFYDVKEWEGDYKKQLVNQKFMRQVRYKRPEGFVDPFAPPPEPEPEPEPQDGGDGDGGKTQHRGRRSGEEGSPAAAAGDPASGEQGGGRGTSSAAHVDKIRNMKKGGAGHGPRPGPVHGGGAGGRGGQRLSGRGGHGGAGAAGHGRDSGGGDYSYDQDSFEAEDGGGGGGDTFKVNVFEGGAGFKHDAFFNEELDGMDTADKVELAAMQRFIRITDTVVHSASAGPGGGSLSSSKSGSKRGGGGAGDLEECRVNVFSSNADLQCWLIDNEAIVISVITMDHGHMLDAESEISVADLAVLRGMADDHEALLSDLPTLRMIANEIISNVEMKVERGVPRLVLSLVGDSDMAELAQSFNQPEQDPGFAVPAEVDALNAGGSLVSNTSLTVGSAGGAYHHHVHHVHRPPQHSHPSDIAIAATAASDEEVASMLLEDSPKVIKSCGRKLTINFNYHTGDMAIHNISKIIQLAKMTSQHEDVYALLKIAATSDDQMMVTAYFLTSTKNTWKKSPASSITRPAVMAGTFASLITPLPSLFLADPDVISSFADNISTNLRVEHDCKTGENKLIVVMADTPGA